MMMAGDTDKKKKQKVDEQEVLVDSEKEKLEDIEIKDDVRFQKPKEENGEKKKDEKKIGFGSVAHRKGIKKRNRQEKFFKLLGGLKKYSLKSMFFGFTSIVARTLDYALNFFILG